MKDSPRRTQLRLIGSGLLRATAVSMVMVAVYYALPLTARSETYVVLELAIGVILLAGVIAWELKAIVDSDSPGIRAMQALATATSLLLLLFAASYFILSVDDRTSFTEPLSRSDAIYFTMTIFATVGFGDITAQGETARLVVTGQMLLDLAVLGLGLQLIVAAVQRGRESQGRS